MKCWLIAALSSISESIARASGARSGLGISLLDTLTTTTTTSATIKLYWLHRPYVFGVLHTHETFYFCLFHQDIAGAKSGGLGVFTEERTW